MTERDVIAGAVLIDDLHLPDGTQKANVPGGAGLYALSGAALFSDHALLATGTGADFEQSFGAWMTRNGLNTDGLRIAVDSTPRNTIAYAHADNRVETPLYGFEHFRQIEPAPADVANWLDTARSLYVFRNTDPTFWSALIPQIEERDITVMWEIADDACTPDQRKSVAALAGGVSALSINLREAAALFETNREDTMIDALRTLQTPIIFLRAGARGSYVITPKQTTFVRALEVAVTDVTGGGNAYSGAAMIGLADGRTPDVAAAMGAVAARFAIGQYGPAETGDPAVRTRAYDLLDTLADTTSETAR